MNDPWDVKCVRHAGQYMSCMKLNGVPLLPPVLSKECRTEMQYYKLLAKEVEKRITLLKPYVMETDSESEDKTDAPELPECEQCYDSPHEEVQAGLNVNIDKITSITSAKNIEKTVVMSPRHSPVNICNNITSNVVVESIDCGSRSSSPKFFIDLSLSINEIDKHVLETVKRTPHSPPQVDLPERDYNCTNSFTQKVITEKEEVITEVETQRSKTQKEIVKEVSNFSFSLNKNNLTDIAFSQDGQSSMNSKSFTGSLIDLHRDNTDDLNIVPTLIRQRSYTVLNPSPQLLAHLEVQSLNTGIEMSSISMSGSLSNLNSPNKKRRSWDLESAKVKWSSMALELKKTNVVHNLNRNASNKSFVKQQPKKSAQNTSPSRAKSVAPDKTKRSIVAMKPMIRSNPLPNSDPLPKTEPVSKSKKCTSPVRNTTNHSYTKDLVSPKSKTKPDNLSQNHVPPSISESEDPATRIRELYEKIQNQQLLQMASLVEKQKREQLLLQQVFEEQNNVLFKQLKTICPKSPIEVKEAWGDKHLEGGRGPVSLSQLINYKSPEQSGFDSPVNPSSTLTNTNNYINKCDNVLKKSRDITGSIKKQPISSKNGAKIVPSRTQAEASRTRSHSPTQRNTLTSRRLNYDTSASSDRDYDPMLTDRTNDTMADLNNITFPSDNDDYSIYSHNTDSVISHIVKGQEIKTTHGASHITSASHSSRSTDNAIRNMERTIHDSINNANSRVSKTKLNMQATPEERAAATKIVALAKGYLVRRLMRTDRVQATVQTIKDALLCALQLHQDREGIRGADVDLHRRLIQQITAACYSLHDTFVASTVTERCAMIAADRGRRRSLAARVANNSFRQTDLMTQSHTGAFPTRTRRPTASLMTQSNYETFSDEKRPGVPVYRHMASPHQRPWR